MESSTLNQCIWPAVESRSGTSPFSQPGSAWTRVPAAWRRLQMECITCTPSAPTATDLSTPLLGLRAFAKRNRTKINNGGKKWKHGGGVLNMMICSCTQYSLLYLTAIKSYSPSNGQGITPIYKWDVMFNSPRLASQRLSTPSASALFFMCNWWIRSQLTAARSECLWILSRVEKEHECREKINKTFCPW